ncbi:MAG: ABC transporter permease [Holophaga sp.]|nr:ABC transporter permease [Holophaga sp.]
MNDLTLSCKRILAHAYHILVSAKRDAFRLFDVTLWPLVLFLSMTLFAGSFTHDRNVIGVVVLGALGWRIIYHFQMEAVQLYMDNYWMGMIEHVMISPVRWWEFILGGAISAVAKIAVIALLFLGLGHLVFHFTVHSWGATLTGFLACAGCGLVLSVFSLGVALLKRGDAFAFIFAFPDAIAVVSGVFYPVSVFPAPVRLVAETLPTTHAFNLLKATLGIAPWNLSSYFVTLAVWLLLAVLFTGWALAKARRDGKLVKMK